MEAIIRDVIRNGRVVAAVAVLVMLGIGFATIMGMSPDQQNELLWAFTTYFILLVQ